MKERKYNFSSFEGRGVVPGMEHVYIFNLSLFKKKKNPHKANPNTEKNSIMTVFLLDFSGSGFPSAAVVTPLQQTTKAFGT